MHRVLIQPFCFYNDAPYWIIPGSSNARTSADASRLLGSDDGKRLIGMASMGDSEAFQWTNSTNLIGRYCRLRTLRSHNLAIHASLSIRRVHQTTSSCRLLIPYNRTLSRPSPVQNLPNARTFPVRQQFNNFTTRLSRVHIECPALRSWLG